MSARALNAFLRALRPGSYQALAAELQTVHLRRGQMLYEAEDPIEWVHFPLDTVASVLAEGGSGDQVETAMIGNEGATGVAEVCGSGRAAMACLVQLDGTALRVPAARFRRLMAADHDLWQQTWRLVEAHIGESRQSGMCHALHGVEPRLARWLLELSDRSGGCRHLPLTQELMADMLGVQRTTVTAFAARMQKTGAISYSRGRLEIRDPDALEALACECRRSVQAQRERLGLEPLRVVTGELRLVVGA